MKVEVVQGKNLANAAAKTTTLKHYIWSTLPNGKKISNGKYLVPHFEGKNKVDDYIKSIVALYSKTTFLWITFYAQNYGFPMFTPNFVVSSNHALGQKPMNRPNIKQKTSGKHVQMQPVPSTLPILSIGDVTKNVGKFTSAILAQPQLTRGKFVLAYVEEITIGHMLQTWSMATGNPSVYVQTASLEDFDSVWPKWGQEIGIMLKFWEESGEKSWSGEDVLTSKDLGIMDKFVGIEATFESIDWSNF